MLSQKSNYRNSSARKHLIILHNKEQLLNKNKKAITEDIITEEDIIITSDEIKEEEKLLTLDEITEEIKEDIKTTLEAIQDIATNEEIKENIIMDDDEKQLTELLLKMKNKKSYDEIYNKIISNRTK